MKSPLQFDALGPELDKSLSQWFTPRPLAERIVRRARVRQHWRVLEPCAGGGAFVHPLVPRVASVDAFEIDARWCEVLKVTFDANKVRVHNESYLDAPPPERPYDLGILNPPYEKDMEGHFIRKCLGECERVVALIRAHGVSGEARYDLIWKLAHKAKVGMPWKVNFITRPKFVGGGGMHEIVIVALDYWSAGCGTKEEWWRA